MRIGIVGVSGYGGSELLRLCVGHPAFEVVYASGESTVGQTLAQRFPALAGHPTGKVVIQPFVPEKVDGIPRPFIWRCTTWRSNCCRSTKLTTAR